MLLIPYTQSTGIYRENIALKGAALDQGASRSRIVIQSRLAEIAAAAWPNDVDYAYSNHQKIFDGKDQEHI